MRFASFILVALTACAAKAAATPEPTAATATSPASSTPVVAGEPGTAPTAASAAPGSATPADASPPPEPMASALPSDLGQKVLPFPVRPVSPDKVPTVARGAVPVPEGLASKIDPTVPFFVWEQVMPARVVLTFTKHAGLDLYVVHLRRRGVDQGRRHRGQAEAIVAVERRTRARPRRHGGGVQGADARHLCPRGERARRHARSGRWRRRPRPSLEQAPSAGHVGRARQAAGPCVGRRGLPRASRLRGRQRQRRRAHGLEERASSPELCTTTNGRSSRSLSGDGTLAHARWAGGRHAHRARYRSCRSHPASRTRTGRRVRPRSWPCSSSCRRDRNSASRSLASGAALEESLPTRELFRDRATEPRRRARDEPDLALRSHGAVRATRSACLENEATAQRLSRRAWRSS